MRLPALSPRDQLAGSSLAWYFDGQHGPASMADPEGGCHFETDPVEPAYRADADNRAWREVYPGLIPREADSGD